MLEEYHQFPKTEPTPAPTDHRLMRHARINYIGDVPDGTRRQYVPDLNGPLYLLDRGRRHLYLDIKAQFPDFFSGRGMGSGFGFVTFDPEFEKNGKFYTVHTEKFADLSTKPTTYPSQPNTFLHGRGHRVDRQQPRREHVPRNQPRDPAARLRLADPRHPADRLQPHRRPSGTATTACCTSPSGDGGHRR